MTELKPLKYLKNNLGINGDFMSEWKKLDESDKADLRSAALVEMKVLGVTE